MIAAMAYKYRRNQNDFFLMGDAFRICETQYGTANTGGHLFYPSVSTCSTLTLLLANGTALGAHFAKPDTVADIDAILNEMNTVRAGQAVLQMYAVGVLPFRGSDGWMADRRYRWPTMLSTFNTTFGRAVGDPVRGYIQAEGTNRHYRGTIAGNQMLFFQKPGSLAIDKGSWSGVPLTNL
jgi:hypothetical protein